MVYGVTLETGRVPKSDPEIPVPSLFRVSLTGGLFGEGNPIYIKDFADRGRRFPKFKMVASAQIAPKGTIHNLYGKKISIDKANYGPDSDTRGYSVDGLRGDGVVFISHFPSERRIDCGETYRGRVVEIPLEELVRRLQKDDNAIVANINATGNAWYDPSTIQLYSIVDLPNDPKEAQQLIERIRSIWKI